MVSDLVMYAAHNYADKECDSEQLKYHVKKAFKKGAEWHTSFIWHDASDIPIDKEASIIIIADILSSKPFATICTYNNPYLNWELVTHWAYLEDIIP